MKISFYLVFLIFAQQSWLFVVSPSVKPNVCEGLEAEDQLDIARSGREPKGFFESTRPCMWSFRYAASERSTDGMIGEFAWVPLIAWAQYLGWLICLIECVEKCDLISKEWRSLSFIINDAIQLRRLGKRGMPMKIVDTMYAKLCRHIEIRGQSGESHQ
ncbi:uncharacterized protein F4807DRAFT_423847 [Annulohypoxylon truncatum]|uniref:uncharacterized protein n=1 Tax=Annulohypoxylon truncatum TaxID=327061 RepID=UPI002007D518|nr:uncharacterized protein F4807DRAFT_423847 [Annulohypoxylon truncatum]KAI1210107.1 hypothetical protein F4807DRAFT_423847 [Annulohypoxylon truncatum]